MTRLLRYVSVTVLAVLLNAVVATDTDAQRRASTGKSEKQTGREDKRQVAPPRSSVWVVSDEGADEEGEYIYDGSGWYVKEGSGSIMWRSDIDLSEFHDNPNLNGIWIRDNRGSGRNVGCSENNDPTDVTACAEWRDNYGYQDVVEFRITAEEEFYQQEDMDESYDEYDHLADEDLDLDEIRETVDEMADRFAGSRDLFRGLEKSVARHNEDECDECIAKSLKKLRRYAKLRRMDEEERDDFFAVADRLVDALLQETTDGDNEESRIAWADQAFQLRGSQEDYDRVMEADDPEEEFHVIEEGDEVAEVRDRIAWADRAFQLRGNQEDYDRVMDADDPEDEFHAIDESDEEYDHLADEDLDIDEVRETVDEMADRFAGSRDLFKGLEKSVAQRYKDECDDCVEKSFKKLSRYAKLRRMNKEERDDFFAVADRFVVVLQQEAAEEDDDGDRVTWADQAFQLRGSQEDYDRVMEADDPEEEFRAIEESGEEDSHLADNDLDLDEVRETVDEMADRFAGSGDLFKSLEKSVVQQYEDECDDCIEKSLKKIRRYAKLLRMDEEQRVEFFAVADLLVIAMQQITAEQQSDVDEQEFDIDEQEMDNDEEEIDIDEQESDVDEEEQWYRGPNSVRLVLSSITDGIVTVDIEVVESEPISGWSMKINYDRDILKFKSFTPKFVKGAFMPLSMENSDGVEVGGAVLGVNIAKTEGDGILGSIELEILETLPTSISIAKPSFHGVDSDVLVGQKSLEIGP